MKLVPMWQPHASAVALGLKKIETRGFYIKYRGPVAIFACKKWDREIRAIIGSLPVEVHAAFARLGCPLWAMEESLPLGKIIAVGDLVDCQSTDVWPVPGPTNATREYLFLDYHALDNPIERALGNYEQGRYGWVLSNVRPLREPIPYRAHQGVYDLDSATVDAIREEQDPSYYCGAQHCDDPVCGMHGSNWAEWRRSQQ